jgi:hypothetical protein
MKHLRILFILLVILAVLPAVRADMADPSIYHKPLVFVDSCFEITNQEQYPDYLFILYPTGWQWNGSYRLISDQECIPKGYISKPNPTSPEIYAIKKSDFASWNPNANDVNDKRLIHSYFWVYGPGKYSNDPEIKITNFLKISLLNSTHFELLREKSDVLYINGTTLSYPGKTMITGNPTITSSMVRTDTFQNGEQMPDTGIALPPSHIPASTLSTPAAERSPYLSLSFIAGALIAVILLMRRKAI